MYGITAVRMESAGEPRIDEVLMGLLTEDCRAWELEPSRVPLKEVIDRLLEGDAIVAVRTEVGGQFVFSSPAELQVQDSVHGGWEESIAFQARSDSGYAPDLRDLPSF